MYIICKGADFSDCGIGKIDTRVVDPKMKVLFGNGGLDENTSKQDKLKLQTFIETLVLGGVWDNVKKLYVPMFATDGTNLFVDVKKSYDDQVLSSDSETIETTGTRNANGGFDIPAVEYSGTKYRIDFGGVGYGIFGSVASDSRSSLCLYSSNTERIMTYYGKLAKNDYSPIVPDSSYMTIDIDRTKFVGVSRSNNTVVVNNNGTLGTINVSTSITSASMLIGWADNKFTTTGCKLLGVTGSLNDSQTMTLYNAVKAFIE